ncbi:fam-g protein [Plasmodium gallinaceum]|uniref:Fam-g protein n=1 Tax=Plasmodium gallinaceum TaxID=5849 RepID=A0A1J1GT53_PLAGA|nr:fam-g protein [Plasmodium gallinaceum]CRG94483.1 fam-g protein [Plasmodium gallinaceum]
MKTLTLYLKITTFLLLIWMYQCFYNCDSYRTLIDKNILQTKNELKHERVLTEGDIEGKKQTSAKGCLEECPLNNKKKKCKNPDKYENPCDRWQRVNTPLLWERFYGETSNMDPKWIDQKWNVEWNDISAYKLNELSLIYDRQDISEEDKEKKIDSVKKELYIEYVKFLFECKKEVLKNKTECEPKKEMRDNKKESESTEVIRENKTESETKKEQGINEIKKIN